MKFLCLIYNDPKVLTSMPDGQFDTYMKECIAHVEQLRSRGKLVDTQFLQPVEAAVTLRTRNGKFSATDGPFAETKEILGGFQMIEAENMQEAIEIASHIPWTRTGSIEVRPIGELPRYDADGSRLQ